MNYREANNRDRQIEYKTFLSLSDYAEDDEKLYFANTNYNALVIVEKATWAVEQMIPFEGEERAAQNIHLRCVRKADKICFLPAESKLVHIYDIKESKQYTCDFMDKNIQYEAQGEWNYFIYDKQIYLLPGCGKQRLWRWNVSENDMEMEEWWSPSMTDSALRHGCLNEECFYTLKVGTNQLIITNMYKRLTENVCLPDEKVSHITYDGENFWYAVSGSLDIVCWNQEQGILNRYHLRDGFGQLKDTTVYVEIYYFAGHLFVFSGARQVIYVLDTRENKLKDIHFIKCTKGAFNLKDAAPSFKCVDNKLVCLLKNAGDIIFIDVESLETKQCDVCFLVGENYKEYAYKVALSRNALLYEDPNRVDLNTLIRFLHGRW